MREISPDDFPELRARIRTLLRSGAHRFAVDVNGLAHRLAPASGGLSEQAVAAIVAQEAVAAALAVVWEPLHAA